MENQELENLENQIPGEENNQVGAETGTAEGGNVAQADEAGVNNEAATVDEPSEGNVENGDVGNSEAQQEQVTQEPEPEPEKMLTQSQVNELVGKARAEGRAAAMKELYGRYGVNDDNEMNDVFGKGQGYDLLNDEYNTLNGNYKNLSAENALLKSNVVQNRWDDVKAILGSKGMDVTIENIQSEMLTHPEWSNSAATKVEAGAPQELTPESLEAMGEAAKASQPAPTQTSTIRKLGSQVPETNADLEKDNVLKMFGV